MFARFNRLTIAVPLFAIACVKGDGSEPPPEAPRPPDASTDSQGSAPVVHVSNPARVTKAAEPVSIGMPPTDSYGWYALGLEKRKAGDFTGAMDAFDKSRDLNPKFSKTYFNQARVLLDLKRAPEALELIEKGRELDSTSGDGLRLRARALAESGDVESAMQAYRELLVRNDADSWGLNNLGVLLLNRGDIDGALGPLARAVQVQPTAPLFQNNLGMVLERKGHPKAALRHYELAVKHDSTFAKAIRNAERLGAIVGDTARQPEVDVGKLAEEFRQKVKEWKAGVPKG